MPQVETFLTQAPQAPAVQVCFPAQLSVVVQSLESPAVQVASDPAQVQVQGPFPVTTEAVPAEQRLVVGALGTTWPLALPQAPSTPAA